jgi:hypothetical protein
MEHTALTQRLRMVHEPLAAMLKPDRPAEPSMLWVLRCAVELAAVWPSAGERAKAKQELEAPLDPQGLWQVPSPHVPST